MNARGRRAREIQGAIARVLREDWDPIGVRDVAEGQGEYDAYVGGVYRLLASGATLDELIAHLSSIEGGEMGLSRRHPEQLVEVAGKLQRLNVGLVRPADER